MAVNPKGERLSLSPSCAAAHSILTMDVSEDTDLVQQLNSTQEETATHDPVEEDHSSVNFVVGDKFSSYNDLKKKLSEFEESQSVQLTHKDSRTLASSNHPRRKSGFVGSFVPHSRDSTSVVFSILHLYILHILPIGSIGKQS